MEITLIGIGASDNDLLEVTVLYRETIDDHGYSARVNVWVPNVDSRAQIQRAAIEEAQKFLQRALSAHSAADQK